MIRKIFVFYNVASFFIYVVFTLITTWPAAHLENVRIQIPHLLIVLKVETLSETRDESLVRFYINPSKVS